MDQFSHVPILVVGDLMLDRSIQGTVDRVSPEAPVPVVNVKEDAKTAGGAGNVVYNLADLGALPTLVSVRGLDTAGEDILKDFRFRCLPESGIVSDPNNPTIRKIRILGGRQQIARVDFERRQSLSPSLVAKLNSLIKEMVPENRAVIISDYGKGLISPPVIQTILRQAHKRKLVVTVDPKIENFQLYKGVDCLTPNSKEAIEGMRVLPPKTEEGFHQLGKAILKRLNCSSLLLTRGEKGILLFLKKGGMFSIPTRAREVFDVTGAGDTVISTFALARAVGAHYEEAAQLANLAAGLVVAKVGTATVSQKELRRAISQFKEDA